MLELKLWNITLCGLYKSELASLVLPRNSLAPDATEPARPLLTPAATRTLYLKLLEHPALVGELTAHQKSELRAYAEAEQLSVTRLAVELMDANPNYNYPAGYPNGREVEYWQGTISGYADSGRVLHLLASPTLPPDALAPPPAVEAFAPLLLNYTLTDLTALLTELGLLATDTGQATPAATSGAWVGVIHGLLEARRPRLKSGSKAAIWRAFSSAFGAVGSERAVQNGLGTRGSTAEQFRDRTLALLKE